MKPHFDIPAWVNWIAQDKNGCWWGYSVEPLQHSSGWYENEVGDYIRLGGDAGIENPDWRHSLYQVEN